VLLSKLLNTNVSRWYKDACSDWFYLATVAFKLDKRLSSQRESPKNHFDLRLFQFLIMSFVNIRLFYPIRLIRIYR